MSLTAPLARILILCGTVALLGGCSSEPDSHVVSAPPPGAPATQSTVVTTQTTAAPVVTSQTTTLANGQTVTTQTQPTANNTYIVTQAPPALQQEVVIAQPGSDYKWVPGYWTWRSNQYQWVTGHWEIPPHSDSVWVAPHYEPESSGGFRFYEGYWN
jgi:WXXGXW repeat (2 copies)